ncbi:MAG TPA: dihydrofolate reductase [Bacteroidia bacterium]|nr:dihydrofolate reductase [Bacteroidia bacterium]
MKISIIAAVASNNAIGLNNQLLWHLPADLQFFKKTTLNSTIIMGRKTFESIGKALPKRKNIVISSKLNFDAPGCVIVSSLNEAFQQVNEEEVFILGGESIYKQCLPLAHKLYITHVHHQCPADTYFPVIDSKVWKEISRENHLKDDKNKFDYSFVIYEKNA